MSPAYHEVTKINSNTFILVVEIEESVSIGVQTNSGKREF